VLDEDDVLELLLDDRLELDSDELDKLLELLSELELDELELDSPETELSDDELDVRLLDETEDSELALLVLD